MRRNDAYRSKYSNIVSVTSPKHVVENVGTSNISYIYIISYIIYILYHVYIISYIISWISSVYVNKIVDMVTFTQEILKGKLHLFCGYKYWL